MVAMRAVLLATFGSACLASCDGGGTGPVTSSGELRVEARCQGAVGQDQIRVAFRVIDTSDHPINLVDVSVRYFFSHMITTGAEPLMSVDYIEKSATTFMYGEFSDTYVDIRFAEPADQLLPADPVGSGELQVHLHPSDFSNWNISQDDDYSYVACGTIPTGYVPRPTMTAYVGGKLAWGVEP